MTSKDILLKMEEAVAARGCFIVDAQVSRDNDVLLTVESAEGTVDMDDCVALSECFQAIFDRDEEDYSLTVSSAGLDQPFKVLRQFLKAVGSEVEVLLKGGRKIVGTLVAADEDSITLSYQAKEAVEGKKKKETVTKEEAFPLSEVNSVKPHIKFD